MQGATERRQLILEYMCEYRKSTRENLAQEFNVSARTIERDLQILACSYPIYTLQGGAGGLFVEEGYYIGRKYLNKNQSELLEKLSISLQGEDGKIMQSILKTFTRPDKNIRST